MNLALSAIEQTQNGNVTGGEAPGRTATGGDERGIVKGRVRGASASAGCKSGWRKTAVRQKKVTAKVCGGNRRAGY